MIRDRGSSGNRSACARTGADEVAIVFRSSGNTGLLMTWQIAFLAVGAAVRDGLAFRAGDSSRVGAVEGGTSWSHVAVVCKSSGTNNQRRIGREFCEVRRQSTLNGVSRVHVIFFWITDTKVVSDDVFTYKAGRSSAGHLLWNVWGGYVYFYCNFASRYHLKVIVFAYN